MCLWSLFAAIMRLYSHPRRPLPPYGLKPLPLRNEEVSGSLPLGSTNPQNFGEFDISATPCAPWHARLAAQPLVAVVKGRTVVRSGGRWQC